MDEDNNALYGADAARFATTCWSAVLAAGRESSPQTDKALEELCRIYWPPLYAFGG
jgi:RNA polymerase sigma-70 factor (ECF subfamily)